MYTFDEIQFAYDELKHKQKNRLKEEIELAKERVREELSSEERKFAEKLHKAFDSGMTKSELRKATRQYQSPRFQTLWDKAEYTGDTRTFMKDYGWEQEGTTFTFFDQGWDWRGIALDRLQAKAKYSDAAGGYILDLQDDQDLAMFNMRNMRLITDLLNKELGR